DCWLADVESTIQREPFREDLYHLDRLSAEDGPEIIDALVGRIQNAAWRDVLEDLHRSHKLHILQSRYPHPTSLNDPSCFTLQPYLTVPTIDHRKSLTRLVTSSHRLAVEILRWSTPSTQNLAVPRESRICRFCRREVEDEFHAVFECSGNAELRVRRNRFYRNVVDTRPGLDYLIREGKHDQLLRQLLDDFKVNAA
ncbi:hypothetical protein V5O48_004198, partial [Marasmius crinis-equi]